MKLRVVLALSFLISQTVAFSQATSWTSTIPKTYDEAATFYIVGNKGDTVMGFERDGKVMTIKNKESVSYLYNRKVLVENSDTVAIFKKKTIYFPKSNITLIEKKNKSGWEYYNDSSKVLSVSYKYNKQSNNYYIYIESDNIGETEKYLLQTCLGKFDKRVVMDYGENTTSNTILTSIIIALVITNL